MNSNNSGITRKCPMAEWVIELLTSDYSAVEDNESPASVHFHLAQCTSCRALAHRLLEAKNLLNRLAWQQPPEQLDESSNALLNSEFLLQIASSKHTSTTPLRFPN